MEHVDRTPALGAERTFTSCGQGLTIAYHDRARAADRLGFVPRLARAGAILAIRDGPRDKGARAEEIRRLFQGWAKVRGMTFTCP